MTDNLYTLEDTKGNVFNMLKIQNDLIFEGDLDLSVLPRDFAKKVSWPEKFTVNGSLKISAEGKGLQSVSSLPKYLTVSGNLDLRWANNLKVLQYVDVGGIIIVGDDPYYSSLQAVDARIPDKKIRIYDADSREYVVADTNFRRFSQSLDYKSRLFLPCKER